MTLLLLFWSTKTSMLQNNCTNQKNILGLGFVPSTCNWIEWKCQINCTTNGSPTFSEISLQYTINEVKAYHSHSCKRLFFHCCEGVIYYGLGVRETYNTQPLQETQKRRPQEHKTGDKKQQATSVSMQNLSVSSLLLEVHWKVQHKLQALLRSLW